MEGMEKKIACWANATDFLRPVIAIVGNTCKKHGLPWCLCTSVDYHVPLPSTIVGNCVSKTENFNSFILFILNRNSYAEFRQVHGPLPVYGIFILIFIQIPHSFAGKWDKNTGNEHLKLSFYIHLYALL